MIGPHRLHERDRVEGELVRGHRRLIKKGEVEDRGQLVVAAIPSDQAGFV